MIYLDHSATTPVHPQVLAAMLPYLTEHYGNAGSAHRFGRDTKAAVEQAREQVAALLGTDARAIHFTSGGTESNYLALSAWARMGAAQGKRKIVISAVEHPAVRDNGEALAQQYGMECVALPVDVDGVVNPESLLPHLADAALVSVMMANNETGVVQPIKTMGLMCREAGVPFHTDAVQAMGKVPVNLETLPVDALSLSAHKIQGPKGIGVLYLRRGTRMETLPQGGGQERGVRPGTENVAGIVGLGAACALAQEQDWSKVGLLREQLQEGLLAFSPEAQVNGLGAERLPGVLNVAFPGYEGVTLVQALDAQGIAVSAGAACHSGVNQPSHVLLAMGQDHESALSGIRFSLGPGTTAEEIEATLAAVRQIVEH